MVVAPDLFVNGLSDGIANVVDLGVCLLSFGGQVTGAVLTDFAHQTMTITIFTAKFGVVNSISIIKNIIGHCIFKLQITVGMLVI